MWNLPGLGIEPVTPALAGRFLSTIAPRKSVPTFSFNKKATIITIKKFYGISIIEEYVAVSVQSLR